MVGIKDTNDELVALTLRALAELVPLLGSDLVIGGKRAKLFTDGRPVLHLTKSYKQRVIPPRIEPSSTTPEHTDPLILPERPQPDGEEVDTSTDEIEQSADDDLETWEDWDANEAAINQAEIIVPTTLTPDLSQLNSQIHEVNRKKSLPDITELDIKNQTNNSHNGEDVDFFQDMEPVIDSKPRFVVVEPEIDVKKMSLNVAIEAAEDGWGDEEWD